MSITDHLGRAVNVGDFVCFDGGGNRNAEYGLITAKVKTIKADGIVAVRLKFNYNHKRVEKKAVSKNQGKFLLAESVPEQLTDWFKDGYKFTETEGKIIAKWIHKGVWLL